MGASPTAAIPDTQPPVSQGWQINPVVVVKHFERPGQASLLMTQSWEEWWTHRQAMLPFSETWRGWRAGQTGT